jgi:hypothetical protein
VRLLLQVLVCSWLLLLAGVAAADPATEGARVLERVDRESTRAADVTATIDIVTVDADRTRTARKVKVWQKGTARRMVKILAPARLRGVGMLSLGSNRLYLYLPAFGRTRRIAGRDRGEPFMGSNFTQDDLTRMSYGSRFRAEVEAQSAETWTLRLDPLRPADEPFHHLELTVRKSDYQVVGIDCFDRAGAGPVRRLRASDFRRHGSQLLAYKVVAEDLATHSRSTATLSDARLDSGLKKDIFTRRYLRRSP